MRLKELTPASRRCSKTWPTPCIQDWTDSVMAEQRSAAVRALAKKYTVQRDGARQ